MSSIASYLEMHGYEADLQFIERDNTESIPRFLAHLNGLANPLVIAKINFQDQSVMLSLLKHLKELKRVAKVALCGPFAAQHYLSIMAANPFVDAILVGQPEVAALDFVQSESNTNQGGTTYSFARRDHVQTDMIVAPVVGRTVALENLPHPKRSVEIEETTPHVNLEASRGCTFGCSFCHLSKTAISYRSPASVIEEIAYLNRSLGKSLFIFNDSCFWASSEDDARIMAIANGILAKSLDVRLYVYLRVRPLISKPILGALVEAGLVRVFLGVESAVKRIKRDFHKPSDDVDFGKARSLFERDFNLNVHIGFITVEPHSTIVEVELNIDYLMDIEKLFRIGIITEPMRAIPGTESFNRLLERGLMPDGLNYTAITYGYRFQHQETFVFLREMQQLFRMTLRQEAYKFEYFSTVVGLLKSLSIRLLGSLPAHIDIQFQTVLRLRGEGMVMLYHHMKHQIQYLKHNPQCSEIPKGQSYADFVFNFKRTSLELELAYGSLVALLQGTGAGRAVREVYSGMERIRG